MKYAKQFVIILLISLLGESLRFLLPFPVPASIYGMLLMLGALHFKVIRLHQVQETADFLIEIMQLMFIPAGVGLLTIWADLRDWAVPVLVITFVTTVIVMAVTGRVTQFLIRHEGRKSDENAA